MFLFSLSIPHFGPTCHGKKRTVPSKRLNVHRPFSLDRLGITRGAEGAEKSIFSFVGRRRQTKTIRPAFSGSKTYYLSPKGQVAFVRAGRPDKKVCGGLRGLAVSLPNGLWLNPLFFLILNPSAARQRWTFYCAFNVLPCNRIMSIIVGRSANCGNKAEGDFN